MSNFNSILPADIALAMTTENPVAASNGLAAAAHHTPKHLLCSSSLRWSAVGLPVRHALLMEWLAKEMRDAA